MERRSEMAESQRAAEVAEDRKSPRQAQALEALRDSIVERRLYVAVERLEISDVSDRRLRAIELQAHATEVQAQSASEVARYQFSDPARQQTNRQAIAALSIVLTVGAVIYLAVQGKLSPEAAAVL